MVHGLPTPEAEQAAREGRAPLGGCCVFGDERDAPRACVKCGQASQTTRTDYLLGAALRLAKKALDERASAEDLEELAVVLLELDEAVVVDGEPAPARWRERRV